MAIYVKVEPEVGVILADDFLYSQDPAWSPEAESIVRFYLKQLINRLLAVGTSILCREVQRNYIQRRLLVVLILLVETVVLLDS